MAIRLSVVTCKLFFWKRQQTHMKFSPLTMFTSETGPKLVTNMSVFTSVMPPATKAIELAKNVTQHKMHLNC